MTEQTTKKPRRRKGGSPEMKAIEKTFQALQPLTPEQRSRVLNATNILLGGASEQARG